VSEFLASEIIGETADEIRLNGDVISAFAYRALEKTRSKLYGSDDYSSTSRRSPRFKSSGLKRRREFCTEFQ
jgi:hypothetical protein